MFPEGAGPGLIYLINFNSDRLATAAQLPITLLAHCEIWGKFAHFVSGSICVCVCVCSCAHVSEGIVVFLCW